MALTLPAAGFIAATGVDRNAEFAEDLLELLARRRPAWWAYAACRTAPADIDFFPGQGEPQDAARAVCATCPAQVACLAEAFELDDRQGIRGGLSARQRDRWHRTPGDPVERAVAALVEAQAGDAGAPAVVRSCLACPMPVKARQVFCTSCAPSRAARCGTRTMYIKGCRCEPCRTANRVYKASRRSAA